MRLGVVSVLALCLVGIPDAPAWAATRPNVAVAGFRGGPGSERTRLVNLQRQLKKLRGVRVRKTSAFVQAARRLRVDGQVPEDARALADVGRAIDADAIVYASFEKATPETWPRARRKDRVLRLGVYAAADGKLVAERVVRVPKGRLTRAIYRSAARTIEGDLFAAAEIASAPPPPPPPVRDERDYRDQDREREIEQDRRATEPRPVDPDSDFGSLRDDHRVAGSGPSLLRIHAGLALLSRSFDYTAAPESPVFAEGGIQYASSVVPGLVLDVETYPLTAVTDGFARGFGLGLRYEKVFLSTEQEVRLDDGTSRDASLTTTHQHILVRLFYRHLFGAEGAAPEIAGHLGLGWLSFELQENPEYNGAAYQYVQLGVNGYVPLGTPMLAADLDVALFPSADLGDSAEELGESVNNFGWRLYGGLASRLQSGLSLRAGVEYTAISSDVTGAGRGERIGESATDSYLGLRLMGGYTF